MATPGRAIDRLADDAAAWRRRSGVPGVALVLVGLDRDPVILADGLADMERAIPVTDARRFQIGSISKTATAIALLRLVEAGWMDLRDPVGRYLRWFDAGPTTSEVRLDRLLAHTAGLPMGSDADDASLVDVWGLRWLSCDPPGRYWYSNVGYKALSAAMMGVTGGPFAELIEREVLGPLGMAGSRAAVLAGETADAAVGYEPEPGWYPASRAPRRPAPMADVTLGDGNIAATPRDMGRFAKGVLAIARGEVGLLSPALGRAMTARHARTAPGRWYGLGIGLDRLDGHPVIGHAGDMLGFRSSLVADAGLGAAVVVLANLRGAPTRRLARHALRTIRAARTGTDLPSLDLAAPAPTDIAGSYVGSTGRVEIVHGTSGLRLHGPDQQVDLAVLDDGSLEPDHPVLGRYRVRFHRGDGGAVRLTFADRAFVQAGATGFPRPSRPSAAGRSLVGVYGSWSPWRPWVEIVARDGRLTLLDAEGEEADLVRVGPGRFRIGREVNPERLEADAIADGRALRVTISGQPFYRRIGVAGS
jgi:CubicO group peptidase (beta-lactamase class C family)